MIWNIGYCGLDASMDFFYDGGEQVRPSEEKVKENLERQLKVEKNNIPIYDIFIPIEQFSEIKNGVKITSSRKFFPGYLLILMDLYDDENKLREDLWYLVRETKGVIGFIGCGSNKKPIPLSQLEVNNLLDQVKEKMDSIIPKMNFDIGETVRVKDGAFENFEGLVQEMDKEKGKLKILISIFGRSTPVELESWQIEKE